jgi:hypothetical protein
VFFHDQRVRRLFFYGWLFSFHTLHFQSIPFKMREK